MKRLWMVLLVALLAIISVACGKSGDKNGASAAALKEITATFTSAQAVVPTGEFQKYTVALMDKAGQATSVDKVYVFMNMEGMHHPTEGTMHEVEKGVYTIELPLAMAGEWYAEVTLTTGSASHTLDRFTVMAEGKKFMMYMKGYNADTGAAPQGDMNSNHDMDHGEEGHSSP